MDSRSIKPSAPLEQTLQAILDRRRSQSLLRSLTITPPDAVDFSSNDFLSLATSGFLRRAYLEQLAAPSHGNSLGSGGSRLLDGNSVYAENLEHQIAAFHSAPAGLLFNSGFDANSGFFACVPQPGDVIVYDAYIHASVHDGMKLSRAAKCIPFEHNSVAALRRVLEECQSLDRKLLDGGRNIFIAVEAIYSMDGDLTPLKDIVDLVDALFPQKNGHIVIDEAHSTGVLGTLGRGLVCELGLEDCVFARLHTFGKALACSGAIVLCSPVVRHYLINYARPLIYTTFLSYPSLVAIRTSYDFLQEGKVESRRLHLKNLVSIFFNALQDLISKHATDGECSPLLSLPKEPPRSPIFSILTPHPRSIAKHCQDGKLVVRAVVPPTVPSRRIRVCLHAGNTIEQVHRLVQRLDEWLLERKATVVESVHQQQQRARL